MGSDATRAAHLSWHAREGMAQITQVNGVRLSSFSRSSFRVSPGPQVSRRPHKQDEIFSGPRTLQPLSIARTRLPGTQLACEPRRYTQDTLKLLCSLPATLWLLQAQMLAGWSRSSGSRNSGPRALAGIIFKNKNLQVGHGSACL